MLRRHQASDMGCNMVMQLYFWCTAMVLTPQARWSALQVCRTLMELGIDFELDNFLEDGCHSVGIRIPKPKRPRLAIELVPPQRLTVNKTDRLLAEAASLYVLVCVIRLSPAAHMVCMSCCAPDRLSQASDPCMTSGSESATHSFPCSMTPQAFCRFCQGEAGLLQVCQQRLLHSLDWDIIMLPQHEWRKLPSRDAKAHYLESLLTPRPVLPRPVFDAEEEEALAACHAAAQAVHMAAPAFDRRPTA